MFRPEHTFVTSKMIKNSLIILFKRNKRSMENFDRYRAARTCSMESQHTKDSCHIRVYTFCIPHTHTHLSITYSSLLKSSCKRHTRIHSYRIATMILWERSELLLDLCEQQHTRQRSLEPLISSTHSADVISSNSVIKRCAPDCVERILIILFTAVCD